MENNRVFIYALCALYLCKCYVETRVRHLDQFSHFHKEKPAFLGQCSVREKRGGVVKSGR